MKRKTDPDPFAPPGCLDDTCTLNHDNAGAEANGRCPAALERQRYQFRRWARRHPNYRMDRRPTRG